MLRNAWVVGFVLLIGACGGRGQPVVFDGGRDTKEAGAAGGSGGADAGAGSGGGGSSAGAAGTDSGTADADAPVDVPTDTPPDAVPEQPDSKPATDTSAGCIPLNTAASCGPTCATCTAPAGGTPTCAAGTCDFTCGSMKKCTAAKLCIATTGCCDNSDCPMQSGKVGTCDTAKHACDYACAANMKACNGTCIATDACCVDKDCPGTCQKCNTSHACVAALSVDDPTARCSGTCDASGKCKSKQGQHCTSPTADGCVSGVACVDTYCCNTACAGSCMACDVAGAEGTCTAVASGPPHGSHSSCAGPTCSGTDKVVAQSSCNAGVCAAPSAQLCQNAFACVAGACKTTCSGNADCQVGNFCASGSCYPTVPVGIAVGFRHACAVLSDGSVRCWGDNANSQLGNSSVGGASFRPVAVVGLSGAIQIGSGGDHTCAVLNDNTVRCWGQNGLGQLGTGSSSAPTPAPTKVVGVSGATSVATSTTHSCAVVSGGKVTCWGDANKLGNGYSLSQPSSAVTLPGLSGVGSISVGDASSCAATSLGVWCWGGNQMGQLGMDPSATMEAYTPTMNAVNVLNGRVLAAGETFTCVVKIGGDVFCWGDDPARSGDLQNWKGAAVSGISNVDAIGAGGHGGGQFVCVQSAGKIFCWGNNQNGQLGVKPENTSKSMTPLGPLGGLSGVSAVAAGGAFVCALTGSHKVFCWGENFSGQLGLDPMSPPGPNGPPNQSYVPIEVSGW